MGYYNVVEPCVVGKLHYARPTTQPIEVDDAEAGPLVEAGCLAPYAPGEILLVPVADQGPGVAVLDDGPYDIPGTEPDETPAELPPRPRARRRTIED